MQGFFDTFFGAGRQVSFVFDGAFFMGFVFSPSPALLKGILITICAAIASQLGGIVLGGLLAIAGLSRNPALRTFNQAYIFFWRGTPVLVQLVLIYFGLPYLLGGIDMFPPLIHFGFFSLQGALLAGIITFSLHEAAYMSEITRAGILAIDTGQQEAARSLGMSPGTTMRRIILPQAVPVIIPPLGNQFNQMLKTTSLLSVIAVPELFRVAEELQSATYKAFEVYLGVSVYYLLLTGIWTIAQNRIEKALGWRNTARKSPSVAAAAQAVPQP